jgi:hypothetical protein
MRNTMVVMPARIVRQLAAHIAAYIAGLIDGEGTITLTRLHARENRRLVVSIANTEIELLNYVGAQVGTGKITRKRITSARHTPSFCYAITSRQALALLMQVTPYLQSYKRIRAAMALQAYTKLTSRNGRYSPERLAERRQFERSFLLIRSRPNQAMNITSPFGVK